MGPRRGTGLAATSESYREPNARCETRSHGTHTPLIDRLDIDSLSREKNGRRSWRDDVCALSVQSNVEREDETKAKRERVDIATKKGFGREKKNKT